MIIKENINIKHLNTFGFDVVARWYAEFSCVEELAEIINELEGRRFYVLGGGSNSLFTGDYEGVIIHPVSKGITLISETASSVTLRAEAGVVWDDFVAYCVSNNYFGAENLSLIPGTVGAAPVQNIGAYGVEAKDVIQTVYYYDLLEQKPSSISKADCMFGYRDSVFKHSLKSRAIVTHVDFCLSKNFTPNTEYGNITSSLNSDTPLTAKVLRDTIIDIRSSKLPDPTVIGNGGSFFKNPVVSKDCYTRLKEKYPNIAHYPDKHGVKLPAGWLIDQAGWKGYREGTVGVHDKQALVLVHYGGGCGSEIVSLANKIIKSIEQNYGIVLHPEVNFI